MTRALQPLVPDGPPGTAAALVERLGLWDPRPGDERPHVTAVMIGSADGRATVAGRAGGLGSPADRDVLREARAAADALLVGPGTLVAERYATILDPAQQARRAGRGRPAEPLVATVSRRLDERLARVPLLAEPRTRIQLYTESEAAAPAPGAQIETERFAPGTLSLAAALGHLRRERGVRLLVAEGGPTLLRRLLADGLVDELILTLAPLLVAGDGPGVVDGPALDPPARMRLAEVLRAEDHLFLRYVLPA